MIGLRNSALVATCLLAGCLGLDEPLGRVVLALDGPELLVPTADPGTPMLDGTGLADLSLFPLFVVVRVVGDDRLEAPRPVLWPEEVLAEVPDLIELELELPASADWALTAELILAEPGLDPATFVTATPAQVEVVAGEVREVELELVELELATVRASWDPAVEVEALVWIDEQAGALLPPIAAGSGFAEARLSVGRLYWPRVVLLDGRCVSLEEQSVRPTGGALPLEVDLDIER